MAVLRLAGPRGGVVILALAIIATLCLLLAPIFVTAIDRSAPKPAGGTIDFSRHGPLTAPVELSGQWRLSWLSGPPGPPAGAALMVDVPGLWSGPETGLPTHGAVSYGLRISGLAPGRYTLHVPAVYAASRVSVNGRVLSLHGPPGLTKASTVPTIRAHDVTFDADGEPIDLRIDVSAFYERDNGLDAAPVFGPALQMTRWIALDWLRGMLLLSSCLLLACYGAVIFAVRRQERGWLWFGLACVTVMPVLATFSHDNLLLLLAPSMPLLAMRAIQYLTVILALGAMVLYTRHLFPQESPRLAHRAILGVLAANFAASCGAAAFGGLMALSLVAYYAVWVRVAVLAYVLWVVVTATLRRRDGAAVYLLGMAVFFATLVYTDLTANRFIPQVGSGLDLMPLGMFVMLLSHLVIMAKRWDGAITSAELTSRELRQLLDVNIAIASEIELEPLLRRIVQATSQILHADRGSLFLHDEKTDELWSMVAEGLESREIRFPAGVGLAGDCFRRGVIERVTDAYADPRFNAAIDKATGYRTRTLLSAPIVTRDGRKLGVLQAVNRLDGAAFDDADVARMGAFAAQAAVAIENATLFAEVASERNYNDSILRSMSSGVVTLDRDARIVKLNAAARRILGIDPDAEAPDGLNLTLAQSNPWLPAELQAVATSSQPKTLLDADVKTLRGDTISANVSIVPLISGGERVGLLIIVEDITEGKRLQGAMRRFMTQKVVDQVMARDDDLLFGAACQASVLFADIRGFTSLAEHLGPRDTVDMLNEIFTELFEAVAANDGVLDKYIGDAIMAVYGAPLSSGRDPQNAVDSAVAMSAMIKAFNARQLERGLQPVELGVGVASGQVVAGTIGSPKRMDYTVIGDSVNLASRLESVTKTYGVGIVVCEDTAAAIEGHRLRELDALRVRGRRRPARIFQVLTDDAVQHDAALEAYARGRRALTAGLCEEAASAFEAALAEAPEDGPSRLMLERARQLIRSPPPVNWDGVWDSSWA
ncbi:adenylate/guanylate cyclase domain-containing protein [Phenylobacterium sp.]|uniref:adenylate/guanylate cyclase domain-containing protein n=1 Tax=Phenylobacterium sp. TaxID=1871053 RepID=UPI002ED9E863